MSLEVIAIVVSHGVAGFSPLKKLTSGKLPSTPDFAILSMLLFYDVGLALDAIGVLPPSSWFASIQEVDEVTRLQASVVLILAPWLVKLGARITGSTQDHAEASYPAPIGPRARYFYLIAVLVCLYCGWQGLSQVLEGVSIWEMRTQVGRDWGALIVVLYLPIYLTAFYAQKQDSRTPHGMLLLQQI